MRLPRFWRSRYNDVFLVSCTLAGATVWVRFRWYLASDSLTAALIVGPIFGLLFGVLAAILLSDHFSSEK